MGAGLYIDVSPEIEKLLIVAKGNTDLLLEAIRSVRSIEVRIQRHGFLWRKKRISLHEVATVENVLTYLKKRAV